MKSPQEEEQAKDSSPEGTPTPSPKEVVSEPTVPPVAVPAPPLFEAPAIQEIRLYTEASEQQEIVDVLHSKRMHVQDNFALLLERIQDPNKVLERMAFVSESQKNRNKEHLAQGVLVLSPDDFPQNTDVWFIGDVHGDLLGFLSAKTP